MNKRCQDTFRDTGSPNCVNISAVERSIHKNLWYQIFGLRTERCSTLSFRSLFSSLVVRDRYRQQGMRSVRSFKMCCTAWCYLVAGYSRVLGAECHFTALNHSINQSINPSNSTPLSDQFCLSNFTAATSRRSLVTDFTSLMIHRMAASSIRSAGHGIRRRYLVVARGSCRDFATALMMINNRIATSSSRSTGHGIRTRVQTWGNCPAVELWSKLQHYSPGWE
jgi:hypothetical protein